MSKSSRSYNIIINSAVGIIATVLQVILNYVVRIILVRQLGAEINGIHNLFQNIANVMTLLETGFGTALIVHLYRPVADQDSAHIVEIMTFFERIYRTIAIGFLVVAIIVDLFFMERLVDSSIPTIKVKIYFIVFALSFVFNYLTYYKRSILFAEQRNRVSVLVTLCCEIAFRTVELFVIYYTNSYLYFLILMILEKLSANLICNHFVNVDYPYLKHYEKVKVSEDLKSSIYSKVKPLLVYNVSSTVQQSSKSILISTLMGNIKNVGYFGNYQLVVSAAQLLFSQFGGAFTSSFGNLAVSDSAYEMYDFYKHFTFALNWIAIVLCAGFFSCIQDFIVLAFGVDYLLPTVFVFIMMLDMLVYLLSIPLISIQNALGLHSLDKYYMVIQAVVSIFLGYILGKAFGMNGIVMGLVIPNFCLTLLHKGIILYRNVFKIKGVHFLVDLVKDIIKAGIVIGCSYYLTNLIDIDNLLLSILFKGVGTVVISTLFFIVFSYRSSDFKYFKNFFIDKLLKRHN